MKYTNLKTTVALYAAGDSWLVHPPGLKTDTPVVRDMARRRLVKTNPDVDAAKYKENSQTDNAAFIGKKYRLQDTKYGHILGEYDSYSAALKASLARPYTRVLAHPEPGQSAVNRNKTRRKAMRVNVDAI